MGTVLLAMGSLACPVACGAMMWPMMRRRHRTVTAGHAVPAGDDPRLGALGERPPALTVGDGSLEPR